MPDRLTRRNLISGSIVGAAALPAALLPSERGVLQAQSAPPSQADLLWKFQTGDWERLHDPDSDADPTLIIRDQHVIAFDAKKGTYFWQLDLGPNTRAFLRDGDVYLEDGIKLDRDSGEVAWEFENFVDFSSLSKVGETIYFGTTSGTCYAVDAATGSIHWSVSPAPGEHHFNSVHATDAIVFFSTEGGIVFALDSTSGAERWQYEADYTFSILSPEEDVIIAMGWEDNDYLLALDPDTGAVLWRNVAQWDSSGLSAFVVGGNLFVSEGGSDSGYFSSLEITTGSTKWTVDSAIWFDDPPLVANGNVYIVTKSNGISALSLTDGNEKWNLPTDRVSALSYLDDTIYLGMEGGFAVALDPVSGQERWRTSIGSSDVPEPEVVDGHIFWYFNGIRMLDLEDGSHRWRFAIENAITASAAVQEGTAFIGTGDGSVYAVDTETGEAKWQFATGGGVIASPVIDGDGLVVGSPGGGLFRLDSATGGEQWRRETLGVSITPTINDGSVYLESGNDLHSVDTATGASNWSFYLEGSIVHSPIADNGYIYAGGWGGKLFAIDARYGTQVWWFDPGGEIELAPVVSSSVAYVSGGPASPLFAIISHSGYESWNFAPEFGISTAPVIADDILYVGVWWEGLYAIDTVSESILWSTKIDAGISNGETLASPVIVSDDIVFAGGFGSVHAFHARAGYHVWEFQATGVFSNSPVEHEGTVYFAADDGNIYALDATTGSPRWHFDIGAPVLSSPVVTNNIVLVGSSNGALYAMRTAPKPVKAGTAAATLDTTDIHEEPSETSNVIATLAPETDVYISGESTRFDDKTWWPIIAPDGTAGWVDGSLLAGE